MTTLTERSHNFGVDDEGEVVPLENYATLPVANESIVQGMTNLETRRREQAEVEAAEHEAKRAREQAVAERALQNAGVYLTFEEQRQTQLALANFVSDVSMYRGGENGGYKSRSFNQRYQEKARDVEAGARKNHRQLVNHTYPELYKAAELKAAGFDAQDVEDEANKMRAQLIKHYGGPENEKTRAKWRSQNK